MVARSRLAGFGTIMELSLNLVGWLRHRRLDVACATVFGPTVVASGGFRLF